jgi:hypothetical protein
MPSDHGFVQSEVELKKAGYGSSETKGAFHEP